MSKTHRSSNTATFNIWLGIKQRCLNAKNPAYPNYGGRGITIDPSWITSFVKFLEDMGTRPKGMSIDRIDNNKGYYRENCRWATRIEQANNQRNNYKISYRGVTGTISEIIRTLRLPTTYSKVYHKLHRGWTVQEAFEGKEKR